MSQVGEAEKEASEVLHSLLSVERIEKAEVVLKDDEHNDQFVAAQETNNESDHAEVWQAPVTISAHSIFSIDTSSQQFQQNELEDQQVVIWDGHAIQVNNSTPQINAIYTSTIEEEDEDNPAMDVEHESPIQTPSKPKASKTKKNAVKGQTPKKRKTTTTSPGNESTKLEESAAQVKERFKRGCECQDESCFRGLNPDNVYKHRLNIAELTKGEHDMYLMGVTMACLANPDTTVRHKERRRLRAQYVYQGRRVCLDAFLYLENCTHYQLKRIRKHVMTHGVAPRVHGNHGKKPHNTFPLNIYCNATEFLKQYLEQFTGERDVVNTKQPIQLPWDVTRKNLHDAYKEYGQIMDPQMKLMGYSSFRHFMKEQFPQVKFCKVEPKSATQAQPQQEVTVQKVQERPREPQIQKCVINNEVQQVIPLVVAQPSDSQHQQTFLVTPVSPVLPNGSANSTCHATTTSSYSYQLANTGYVINDQGIVTTMANAQHPPYTFSRM